MPFFPQSIENRLAGLKRVSSKLDTSLTKHQLDQFSSQHSPVVEPLILDFPRINCNNSSETRINYAISPPINIHQDSSSENCTCLSGDTQVFKKGKSCLFALPTIVLEKPLQSFPINMSVYKKLPPGVLPDVMLIGAHQIETKDLINALLDHRTFKTGNPCKTLKDKFILKTTTGQHVGEVTVFVRISCFGQKIVTQFQIPHNKKPYLFKGADDSPVFQCKRIPSDLENKVKPIRCNCEETSLKKSSSGEFGKIRTCCPISSPPSCPPPTRQSSPPNLAMRPCCPSKRGEPCPANSLGEKIKDSPRTKIHKKSEPRVRKCGCSISEKKPCSCG